MNKLGWIAIGVAVLIVGFVAAALISIVTPGSQPRTDSEAANGYAGAIPASTLLRVPVTGIYPGGNANGLYPDLGNPLANDPDAVARGMKDFNDFNCSGCHMANGGGGMGPALSDDKWIYRSSPANIYLDIVQGRAAGMPAFGAMLPDRTVWELVAYVQSISRKPAPTFGTTTSADPRSPDTEQVSAVRVQSATPWQYTEAMPPDGEKPGSRK
ncbi:MAG TPA: c-type cytochrome [Rhizomicrobium sp.]|nr:c-type cytochrome [Rhizomicrobium sp.]